MAPKYFYPGNRANIKKLFNSHFTNSICNCSQINGLNQNKNFVSQTNSTNISNFQKQSQVIQASFGGKIQFGNSYLCQNKTNINYLGRLEGQNGGSGSAIKNNF
jgi:hypothetical protein